MLEFPESRILPVSILSAFLLLGLACGGGRGQGGPAPSLGVIAPSYAIEGMTGYQAFVPARSGVTYAWTADNGTIVSGGSTATVIFKAGAGGSTRLVCTETDALGATAWGEQTVPLETGPIITSSSPMELKHGTETLSVQAVPGMTYAWEIQGGEILEGQGTPTITLYNAPLSVAAARVGPSSRTVQATIAVKDAAGRGAGATRTFVDPEEDGAPPAGLVYEHSSAAFTLGQAIPLMLQHSSGGSVASYSVSPALPAGISLDPDSGFISGTPTALAAGATYIVTATNALGSTTATLDLAVQDAAPLALTYTYASATFAAGLPITQDSPTLAGAASAIYTVTPALPDGLSLDPATGVLSGSPTTATDPKTYTVLATNAQGSARAALILAVAPAAPAALTYDYTSGTFAAGAAIIDDSPLNPGGPGTTYAVSPPLPAGLNLNASTGLISGTLDPALPAGAYPVTVTASNNAGSSTASLTFTVATPAAPATGLTYQYSTGTFTAGTAITSDAPVNPGGTWASFSANPALPAGLALDNTGAISGTLATNLAAGIYAVTITATGPAGSSSENLIFTVNPAPPAGLTYTYGFRTFTVNSAIASDNPTSTGGAVASYGINPPLPAGLSMNSSTGIISGTPTGPAAQATYTVTATNTSGQTSAQLTFTVIDVPPTGLTYAYSKTTFVVGTAITDDQATHSGGSVTSYSVLPSLPSGLNLNAATGVISGTPTAAAGQASYTVTASNTTGSTTATLSFSVESPITLASQPADVSTFTGRRASFSVSAQGGTPPYTYQWQRNGSSITNANSATYLTPVLTAADSTAQFSVLVTSSGGPQVASSSATLTVAQAQPRFAYVANETDNTLSIFTVTPGTGQLRPNGYVPVGSAPYAVLVDPTGKYVFVANEADNTISSFTMNASTGALTLAGTYHVGPSGGSVQAQPLALASDPSGAYLYVANYGVGTLSAFKIGAGGSLASLGPDVSVGTNPAALAVESSGRFAYVLNSGDNTVQVCTIGPDGSLTALTSSSTPSGVTPAGSAPQAIAVSPDGRFLCVADTNQVLTYPIDPTHGTLGTGVAMAETSGFPVSLSFDPLGTHLFLADTGSRLHGFLFAYTFDSTSGALAAATSDATLDPGVGAMVMDPSGAFVYVVSSRMNEVTPCAWNAGVPSLTATRNTRTKGASYAMDISVGSSFVTYQPGFVYASEQAPATATSSNVSEFTLDPSSGSLAPLTGGSASIPAGSSAVDNWISTDPAGRFAYVSNRGDNTLYGFTIDPALGSLTAMATPYSMGGSSYAGPSVVDPSGRFLFAVTTSPGDLIGYAINATDGGLTQIGSFYPLQNTSNDVAADPTGRFVYSATPSGLEAFSVATATGALTTITGTTPVSLGSGAGNLPVQVAVDPTGRFLYVACTSDPGSSNPYINSISYYSLDPITGSPTPIGSSPMVFSPVSSPPGALYVKGMALDLSGDFAYLTLNPGSLATGALMVLSLDPATGVPTVIGATTGATFASGSDLTTSILATKQTITGSPVVDPSGAFLLFPQSGSYSVYGIQSGAGTLKFIQDLPDIITSPSGSSPTALAVTAKMQ